MPFIDHPHNIPSVYLSVFRSKPVGPGEMGKAVVIPKDKEIEMKELFKINQFNLMASDLVSVNRSLPDYRLDR